MKRLCSVFLGLLLCFSLSAKDSRYSGSLDEFLNVETHFIFENNQTGKRISNVYGATSFNIGDGLPVSYKKGEKMIFRIEFIPSSLKEEQAKPKVFKTRRYDEKDIDIPVRIEITSKKSHVEMTAMKSIENIEKEKSDQAQIFTFTIKNKADPKRYIEFEITGREAGDEQIFVSYGSPEYKIVDSTCDVFETIHFTNE